MGGRWEVQWVGGGKNKEKKIKHTVTTCLKRHHSIGTKACLGTTLHCMYVCNAATSVCTWLCILDNIDMTLSLTSYHVSPSTNSSSQCTK